LKAESRRQWRRSRSFDRHTLATLGILGAWKAKCSKAIST
jgi:hypothetical protein